jgi:hypothetical protein
MYDTALGYTAAVGLRLDDLIDVDVATTPPILNDALIYNGTEWVNTTLKEKIAVDDLTDVDLTFGPAVDNYSLMYNAVNARWYAQRTVKSVNGENPDPLGNVIVSLTKVTTGTLAARPPSGDPTLINAEVYIISGDPLTANNGRTFIYQLSTTTWFEINALGPIGTANIRVVSYLGSDVTGTGTFNAPYQTITYAISQSNFGVATVIVVLPGTYVENLLIGAHLNLSIVGLTSSTTTYPIALNGNITLSSTATRVRIKDMQINGTSANPVPLIINGSNNRHVFDNVEFIPFTTSDAVDFTGTPNNWNTFIDCGFGGAGKVDMGTTPGAAACYFIRPRTLYNLTIGTIFSNGL